MRHTINRRRFLTFGLLIAAPVGAAGCGTMLHPERIGQPPGQLDWGVVVLDALGLLFFLVPGVIAFAVDFSNGTIYLPPWQTHVGLPPPQLGAVRLPRERPTIRDIELAVSRHVGREVTLRPGEYVTQPLTSLDQFWTTHGEMLARHAAGPTIVLGQSP